MADDLFMSWLSIDSWMALDRRPSEEEVPSSRGPQWFFMSEDETTSTWLWEGVPYCWLQVTQIFPLSQPQTPLRSEQRSASLLLRGAAAAEGFVAWCLLNCPLNVGFSSLASKDLWKHVVSIALQEHNHWSHADLCLNSNVKMTPRHLFSRGSNTLLSNET